MQIMCSLQKRGLICLALEEPEQCDSIDAGCELLVAVSQSEGRQEGVKQKLSGDAGGSSAAEHSSVRAKASHFPKHCRHMACGALKPLETKMACRS